MIFFLLPFILPLLPVYLVYSIMQGLIDAAAIAINKAVCNPHSSAKRKCVVLNAAKSMELVTGSHLETGKGKPLQRLQPSIHYTWTGGSAQRTLQLLQN